MLRRRRGHYLPTRQCVQGFRQSSEHWKLRSGVRQERAIEVPHRQALNVGDCFELCGGLGVPDLAGE